MSGTLDAALKTLRWEREWIESEADAAQIKAAIRILEAAGKVDKDRALRVLATLLQRYVMGMGTMPELERDLADGAAKQIRALLDAIPDGGKE